MREEYKPLSLDAFDQAFFAEQLPPSELLESTTQSVETPPLSKSKKSRKSTIISNITFYVAIIFIVFTAFIYSTNDNNGKSVFGYSYYTVLTTSMQREIPKGSFVLVKHAGKNTIKVGDDITYMKDQNTTITHRVVEIIENYENSGARGFRTKGIENASPDPDIVYAANVIGPVVWHAAGLGGILSLIGENLWFVFLIFALLLILSFSLKKFFGISKEEKLEKSQEHSNEKESAAVEQIVYPNFNPVVYRKQHPKE